MQLIIHFKDKKLNDHIKNDMVISLAPRPFDIHYLCRYLLCVV